MTTAAQSPREHHPCVVGVASSDHRKLLPGEPCGWSKHLMRIRPAVIALSLAALLGGWVSGNPQARNDYADPSFGSPTMKQAARTREIRRMYPNLSEEQIAERVRLEFPFVSSALQREKERQAAQRKAFEDELAASRRMD